MKKLLLITLVVALGACSRNPDPEYAPARDDADEVSAAAAVSAAPAAAPEAAPAAAPADAPRLSEDETMRLGREAVALLFARDIDTLWLRFDADIQAQVQSPARFSEMVESVFGNIGEEGNLVSEVVLQLDDQPGISSYRRRGHYLAIGQNGDLFVHFNADGTIAGINIQPAEE